MAAFEDLKWDDPDVYAVVVGRGIGTVEARFEQACDAWLLQHGYQQLTLDFGRGISPVVTQLGTYFDWAGQFGYTLEPESRNLAALSDGFRILDTKLAMKLQRFELAWSQDKSWSSGFLSIVSECSIRQLALGRSFFALIPIADGDSALLGEAVDEIIIPFPFRFRRDERSR